MKSTIILIGGLPATGKTTLGKEISQKLKLPYFSKDIIKELMFDTLGYSDREWSKKVGSSAYSILDYFIEEELKSERNFVLESNFKPEFDNSKFQDWQNKYNFNSIQIICDTDPKVLLDRFIKRANSSERHPGHAELNDISEWENTFKTKKSEPLDIMGHIINIDTTYFNQINSKEIINKVQVYLRDLS